MNLGSPSTRIAENKIILLSYEESRNLGILSVMILIKLSIIIISYGVAKLISKTNLPRLEIKQINLYSHTFKCLNFKDEYQADSNLCSF